MTSTPNYYFLISGLLALFTLGVPVNANDRDLVTRINDYRSSPGQCDESQAEPVEALAEDERLGGLQGLEGAQLEETLRAAGYHAVAIQVISLSGPEDAGETMAALESRYCEALLNSRFTEVGVSRDGQNWQVTLAEPLLDSSLGDWEEAGRAVLERINLVRREARRCGDQRFEPAAELTWNEQLAAAALAHSRDMADQNYFSHEARDGSQVAERAERAGYRWRRIGENLASGQGSVEEVVAGWLESPGHCANLMSSEFEEMGAAYALNPDTETFIFWTQVFGAQR